MTIVGNISLNQPGARVNSVFDVRVQFVIPERALNTICQRACVSLTQNANEAHQRCFFVGQKQVNKLTVDAFAILGTLRCSPDCSYHSNSSTFSVKLKWDSGQSIFSGLSAQPLLTRFSLYPRSRGLGSTVKGTGTSTPQCRIDLRADAVFTSVRDLESFATSYPSAYFCVAWNDGDKVCSPAYFDTLAGHASLVHLRFPPVRRCAPR